MLYRVMVNKWDYGRAEKEMLSFIPWGVETWPKIKDRMREIKDKYEQTAEM